MTGGAARRGLTVLGATGTIGQQTLALVSQFPNRFVLIGLAANADAAMLAQQIAAYAPRLAALEAADEVTPQLVLAARNAGTKLLVGPGSAARIVREGPVDVVVNAISGLAGLMPALAALERPVILGMASKEPLVAAGLTLRRAARASGAIIVSVDSEPAALQQCLGSRNPDEAVYVYLTASGGPFWGRDRSSLVEVTPDQAVRHPRWRMGRKISVDSATMFNKGLEAIEIAKLFDISPSRIRIVVHRQSVVHAMVEWHDGSILAQLAPTDMRIPISQALFWPHGAPAAPLRLSVAGLTLDFAEPALADWPCLAVALEAARLGGAAPAVVSAADEVLVGAFLDGTIGFLEIAGGLEAALCAYAANEGRGGPQPEPDRVEDILCADAWARSITEAWVRETKSRGEPSTLGEDVIT